jgi:hypothetical protein
LDHVFLDQSTPTFMTISCVWRAKLYHYHWYWFHSETFSFRWLIGSNISLLSYFNAVTFIPSN